MPRSLAWCAMAIYRGRTLASCFFCCGEAFGASALASFSNSALVMIVLQSAAALAAAGFSAHTPVMVRTGASAGTDAEVSAGAGWFGACVGGGGAFWAACPQASVPNKTHTSQLIRITGILQDWSTRKVKIPAGNRSTTA